MLVVGGRGDRSLLSYTKEVVDDMVMSDVKEEEVVNRVTKMAAELHFSGDWSSISGMKVPGCRGNELVMEKMDGKAILNRILN